MEVFEKLKRENPEKYSELIVKCSVDDGEFNRMRKAAENMYFPFDEKEGIYMQDDNFIYKDPIDIENIPIEKLPLHNSMHPLNLWRYQVCKQADIVLLTFLEGDWFSTDMKKRIFDFYEPKTIHDSSLSAGIYSIVACEIGYAGEAYGYLKQACRMDLDNVNRNTGLGIHAACMGSCWQMIVNGYAGMRTYGGELYFNPFTPDNWNGYKFRIKYKGNIITVTVKKNETIYELSSGNGLTFFHRGGKVDISPENFCVAIRK